MLYARAVNTKANPNFADLKNKEFLKYYFFIRNKYISRTTTKGKLAIEQLRAKQGESNNQTLVQLPENLTLEALISQNMSKIIPLLGSY